MNAKVQDNQSDISAELDEKLVSEIQKILANKDVAQAIKNSALKHGNLNDYLAEETKVIGKIVEFFSQDPLPKTKLNDANVTALANIIGDKGLDVSVKNISPALIQLSSLATINHNKANQSKGFFDELGDIAKRTAVSFFKTITSPFRYLEKAVNIGENALSGVEKSTESLVETTINAGTKIIDGIGDGGKVMMQDGLSNSGQAVTRVVNAGAGLAENTINTFGNVASIGSNITGVVDKVVGAVTGTKKYTQDVKWIPYKERIAAQQPASRSSNHNSKASAIADVENLVQKRAMESQKVATESKYKEAPTTSQNYKKLLNFENIDEVKKSSVDFNAEKTALKESLQSVLMKKPQIIKPSAVSKSSNDNSIRR